VAAKSNLQEATEKLENINKTLGNVSRAYRNNKTNDANPIYDKLLINIRHQ